MKSSKTWLLRHWMRLLTAVLICFALPIPAMATSGGPDGPFRGKITYRGEYQMTDVARNGRAAAYAGLLEVTLEFSGTSVDGRYSGTGGIHSGRLRGQVMNGQCRLYDEDGGWFGPCDPNGFSGAYSGSPTARHQVQMSWRTTPIQVVDYSQRDEQAAAAAARAQTPMAANSRPVVSPPRSAPPAPAKADTSAKRPATAAQIKFLRDAVKVDSASWNTIHYNPAALRNFYVHEGGAFLYDRVHADFTLTNGTQAWVELEVIDGAPHCLLYWDSDGACNLVRSSENLREMQKAGEDMKAQDRRDCLRQNPLRPYDC